MQVILVQDEIMSALESYVRNQITVNANQKIVIDLKAGRGENGFSATLDIQPADKAATNPVNGTAVTIDRSSFVPVQAEVVAITRRAETNGIVIENDAVIEETQAEAASASAGSIFSFAKSSAE